MNSAQMNISQNDNTDIQSGLKVLKTELLGLQALLGSIDENFVKAVEAIDSMKSTQRKGNYLSGRLIIAGIGKSGHVARKIAATMASTGTPAYFVHPGEASHGDLGMITENDIVLMLSNSGENAELSDLIRYTRRFEILLIAMTSNASSTLARHSDITLLMPKVPEACPNGQAPTTSTTMMMAFGDALAITLLDRMGLTPEQFGSFHPGGKLGRRLLKISEIMVPLADMAIIDEKAKMDEALIAMTQKNLGCVIILDKNKDLKGIITDGDLKRHMTPNLLQKQAIEIMSPLPKTISCEGLAVEALDIMTKTPGHYLTSLIVMDDDKLIGLIRLQDCLQAGLV